MLDSSERCLSLSSLLKPPICASYAYIFSSSFYYHSISNLRQNKIVSPKNKKLLKKAAKRKEWKTPFFFIPVTILLLYFCYFFMKSIRSNAMLLPCICDGNGHCRHVCFVTCSHTTLSKPAIERERDIEKKAKGESLMDTSQPVIIRNLRLSPSPLFFFFSLHA